MNSFKDKAEALVLLAIGGQTPESLRELWEKLIREAQNTGLQSYENCTMIVQIAGTNSATKSIVRNIAIDWYGKDAEDGNQEAAMLLRNFAKMAGDTELLACFSDHYPKPVTSSGEVMACDVMPPEALEKLGLSPDTTLVHVCSSPAPRLVYKPGTQK